MVVKHLQDHLNKMKDPQVRWVAEEKKRRTRRREGTGAFSFSLFY